MPEFTKVQALKQFFGRERPVENTELLALRRDDPAGFDEMAEGAAKALGGTIILKVAKKEEPVA